jgi:hypothetical protein
LLVFFGLRTGIFTVDLGARKAASSSSLPSPPLLCLRGIGVSYSLMSSVEQENRTMDRPDSTSEQKQSTSNASDSESRPISGDRKEDEQREASISTPSEDYVDDDIDRNTKAFWEWLKREKIPAHGWITALSSIALLTVTFGQLVIACNNYRETSPLVDYARRNTEAAEKFSATADKINQGVGNAVGQLGQQVGKLDRQAGATEIAANAAKKSSQISEDALHTSQRAYIVAAQPVPDFSSGNFMLGFVNVGHIPSGPIDIQVFEANFSNPHPEVLKSTSPLVERHWRNGRVTPVSNGVPSYFYVSTPKVTAEGFNSGIQIVEIGGIYSYRDGFPETPIRTERFCFLSVFDSQAKSTKITNCDPGPELNRLINVFVEYPNNEEKEPQ